MRTKLTKRVCVGQWQVPKYPGKSAEWLKVKACRNQKGTEPQASEEGWSSGAIASAHAESIHN